MESLLGLVVLLACPLMMYFCMRGMMGRTDGQHASCGPMSRKASGLTEAGFAERMSELETQQEVLLHQISALQTALQQTPVLGQKVTELATQQQMLLEQMTVLQSAVQRLSGVEEEYKRLNGGAPRAALTAASPEFAPTGEHKET